MPELTNEYTMPSIQDMEEGEAPVETGWVGTSGVRTYDQIFYYSETFIY